MLTRIRNLLGVRLPYTKMREHGERLARYDTLTGLPNRFLFQQRLLQALALANASLAMVAMLLIDLDGFKHVNDTLGQVTGDDLLRQSGARIASPGGLCGRLGGDEFGIILACPGGQHDAALLAEKIKHTLAAPFFLGGSAVHVTASIGIAVAPSDASDATTLIQYAETAMCQAKLAGRDSYRFFSEAMNLQARTRMQLESALRKAVDDNEFVLLYQPKVRISSGDIIGAEALLRWNRPGHWIIAEACRQIVAWAPVCGPVPVAINVASRQFAHGDLASVVAQAIAASGIAPELLALEVTESALMLDMARTIDTLTALRAMGTRIAIDDFGTGYSSLAYLKHFPVDTLKIDMAFIRDVTTDPDSAAIVRAIIGMAHSMQMDVIAEGGKRRNNWRICSAAAAAMGRGFT